MADVSAGPPEGSIEHAVILSCGDELTTGRIADTNAAFIADALGEIGVSVAAVLVVGDDPGQIVWAWRQAMEQGDVVIATGGLGPTADDLTTETLAGALGLPLVHHEESAARIREIFATLGRAMPGNNLKQAALPQGAVVIPNPLGTAPGYRLAAAAGGRPRHLVVLPGVPREMKRMWAETVLPWLRQARGGPRVRISRTFQTFGLTESGLDERVGGALTPGEARLSFRASFPEISVRVSVAGEPGEIGRRLDDAAGRVRDRIADVVFGEGDATMEGVVGELLRRRGLTLAVAESCTGGLIGHRVTNVPGSSAYFVEGLVCYTNAAKERLLGVAPATLAAHGAVSEATAREMAMGVRRVARSDLGLATTGIAGPDGGTPEKPVGTVCIALAWNDGIASRRYQLWSTRDWIKLLTSQIALDWVRRHVLGLPVADSGIAGAWEQSAAGTAAR
jgi:nicotinamide-nucleotide amidase